MSFEDLKTNTQPLWLVILLILIIIALLLLTFNSKDSVVKKTDLEMEIERTNPTIMLVDKKGGVQLFNPKDQTKINKCLEKNNTDKNIENTSNCGDEVGSVISKNTITITTKKVNPLCRQVRDGNGFVWWYHLDGPNIWLDPCHASSH